MKVIYKRLIFLSCLSIIVAIALEMIFLFATPQNYKFNFHDIRLSYFLFLIIICAACVYMGQKVHIAGKIKNKYNNIIANIKDNPSRILKVTGIYVGISIISAVIELVITKANKSFYNPYQLLFFIGIGFILMTGILLWGRTAKQPETLFLIICLTAGVILASSLPAAMIVSWDDETHFKNALNLSYFNGVTIESKADQTSEARLFPVTFKIEEVVQQHNTLNDQYNNEITHTTKNGKSSVTLLPFLYTQLGYIPSALGLFIGRLLHLPYFLIFILGRVFNVISYAVVIYYAMKRLKSGKMLLAVIALFPTNIFLASNYSYDTWVTSWIMLGAAYFIGALQRPDEFITIKESIIMIGAFFIGFGPKAIYFPLLLILLLIPESKFKTIMFKRRFRIYMLLCIGITFASIALPLFIKGPGIGDTRGGAGVNSALQLQFILQNPIQYIDILFNFLKSYLSLENINNYTMNFAYLGITKGFICLLALTTIVMFTDHQRWDEMVVKRKTKIAVLLLVLFTVILVVTALYISFNPVGSNTVLGCQARYLIPCLFPILFIWGSHKIVNQTNKSIYNSIVLGISSLVLLSSIWTNCVGLYS